MDPQIIETMVQALKPTLKSPRRAKAILEAFWRGKIAIIWDTRDVHTAANEQEVALTEQEAIEVVRELHRSHDKQQGLRWEDLTSYIQEYALGRKLTRAELRRFIHKNILTIARERR